MPAYLCPTHTCAAFSFLGRSCHLLPFPHGCSVLACHSTISRTQAVRWRSAHTLQAHGATGRRPPMNHCRCRIPSQRLPSLTAGTPTGTITAMPPFCFCHSLHVFTWAYSVSFYLVHFLLLFFFFFLTHRKFLPAFPSPLFVSPTKPPSVRAACLELALALLDIGRQRVGLLRFRTPPHAAHATRAFYWRAFARTTLRLLHAHLPGTYTHNTPLDLDLRCSRGTSRTAGNGWDSGSALPVNHARNASCPSIVTIRHFQGISAHPRHLLRGRIGIPLPLLALPPSPTLPTAFTCSHPGRAGGTHASSPGGTRLLTLVNTVLAASSPHNRRSFSPSPYACWPASYYFPMPLHAHNTGPPVYSIRTI